MWVCVYVCMHVCMYVCMHVGKYVANLTYVVILCDRPYKVSTCKTMTIKSTFERSSAHARWRHYYHHF